MQKFSKTERLCSRVIIDEVFEKGKSISGPSFKLIWKKAESIQQSPVQILLSVPKRNFKKAVDRNKIKRRMREIYRKNKNILHEKIKSDTYYIMLIYTGKDIIEYKEAEVKILNLLKRLTPEIEQNEGF
jgi:ribonuclease P protein component